jgi:hypothetical protein
MGTQATDVQGLGVRASVQASAAITGADRVRGNKRRPARASGGKQPGNGERSDGQACKARPSWLGGCGHRQAPLRRHAASW